MDPQVVRAMARWPDVPAVYGWLRLDRRGSWMLVDRGQPDFDEQRDSGGSPITNRQIIDFIGRNYTSDPDGRWYWQNGPQRVYVDLECAPLVLRVLGAPESLRFVTHTGEPIGSITAGWSGPQGEVLLSTDLGPAVVHDLDLATLELVQHDNSITLRLGDSRDLTLTKTERPQEALGFVARPRISAPT